MTNNSNKQKQKESPVAENLSAPKTRKEVEEYFHRLRSQGHNIFHPEFRFDINHLKKTDRFFITLRHNFISIENDRTGQIHQFLLLDLKANSLHKVT